MDPELQNELVLDFFLYYLQICDAETHFQSWSQLITELFLVSLILLDIWWRSDIKEIIIPLRNTVSQIFHFQLLKIISLPPKKD